MHTVRRARLFDTVRSPLQMLGPRGWVAVPISPALAEDYTLENLLPGAMLCLGPTTGALARTPQLRSPPLFSWLCSFHRARGTNAMEACSPRAHAPSSRPRSWSSGPEASAQAPLSVLLHQATHRTERCNPSSLRRCFSRGQEGQSLCTLP